MALGEADATTRQRRQLERDGDRPGHARRVGRRGRHEPPAARARPRHRCIQPARQGARRAESARRGARGLRAGPRARRDEPDRAAQRRAPAPAPAPPTSRPQTARAAPTRRRRPSSSRRWARPGRARLINLAAPRVARAALARRRGRPAMSRGDELVARVGKAAIGSVEPRIAARLLKLIAGGNRYEAAITTVHEAGGGAHDHHPRGLHRTRRTSERSRSRRSARAAVASDRT